ncbi:MAG: hypothetical protein WC450_07590 [Candidatus Omnitrophota bacterium]|jgi:hypothetical protein
MRLFLIITFIFIPISGFAQQNTVILKDGQIIVDSSEGIKGLDYSASDRYSDITLKKWKIKSGAETVNEALKVFKKRSPAAVTRKIWLVDRKDDSRQILVKYTYGGGKDKVLFSGDENFLLFFDLTPNGASVITGMNLLSQERFVLGHGQDFNVFSCPDTRQYVVVQSSSGQKEYYVYDLLNMRPVPLDSHVSTEDLSKFVCY